MNEIIWTRNALRFSTHIPQDNVKALTLWSSWVFTRQNGDFTGERELMQGYLGVSELLFQRKDIKSCFRAFFPKLCLKESSSLANLRWLSSLAIKCLDLTACCFSADNHLTCLILRCLYLSRGLEIHLSPLHPPDPPAALRGVWACRKCSHTDGGEMMDWSIGQNWVSSSNKCCILIYFPHSALQSLLICSVCEVSCLWCRRVEVPIQSRDQPGHGEQSFLAGVAVLMLWLPALKATRN